MSRKFAQLALPVSPLSGVNMCSWTSTTSLFSVTCNQSKSVEPGYRDCYVELIYQSGNFLKKRSSTRAFKYNPVGRCQHDRTQELGIYV